MLSQSPLIQQRFLLAPNYSTVFDRLKGPPYNSYFLFDGSSDGKTRIIPSKGMMDAFLQAKFGEQAPNMAVRFLISSNDGLRKRIKENARDFYLNFKGLDPANEVDGFACDAAFNEAEYHDFSHLVFFGYIPDDFKKKFYVLTKFIKKEPAFESAYAQLVNMEHHPFLSAALPPWQAFWESVAENFRTVGKNSRVPLIEKLLQKVHKSGKISLVSLKSLSSEDVGAAALENRKLLQTMVQVANAAFS